MIRLLSIALAVWIISVAPGVRADGQVPGSITYQGCLTDSSGMPLNNTTRIIFSIYAEPVGGLPMWSEQLPVLPDARGIFTTTLGLQTAFPAALFDGQKLWLSLALEDHEEMSPRQPLTSVPYALGANIGEIDPSQVKGHAAVLNESQVFSGENYFEQTVNARGGSATSSAIRGDNRNGGIGLQVRTNSDLHPALLVLTGVTDVTATGDNLGTGPLIECWSATFEASPPTSTFHRRLVVDNDGSIRSGNSFTGGRSGYAEMIAPAAGSEWPEEGDVMVIDRNSSGCVAICETARSTRVAGICAAAACFMSCGQTDSPARSPGVQFDSTGLYPQPPLASVRDDQDVIALVTAGIAMCRVSGENGIIIPGDLLVTSPVSGHAMKDTLPKPGTIIGKALDSLTTSMGTIRVLVTLD
jgi:hypothetical protein